MYNTRIYNSYFIIMIRVTIILLRLLLLALKCIKNLHAILVKN